ncbi:MAG: DUF1559 domain-containing protein [Gemmataceae bacterium]|nr:DUF1559 domain-containing protein [Gemmataceae bacterium]MDW8267124.1 DUF1559 domain-containing protein [Gemmataceae bacterium]
MILKTQQSRRSGLNLTEVLIVVAIIVILALISFPAVLRARDVGNRIVCASNLEQIGTALFTYQGEYGAFPPGGVDGPMPKAGVRNGTSHGWAQFILSGLGRDDLARQYRWDQNWDSGANLAVVQTRLGVMECPSAPKGRTGSRGAAISDYGALYSFSSDLIGAGFADRVANREGVLVPNQRVRLDEIYDGASYTITVAEDAGRPQAWRAGRLVANSGISGGAWGDRKNSYIVHGFTYDGAKTPGPAAVNATNNNEVYGFHPGGANVLFADRSVRFVPRTVDIRLFNRLVTRDGREPISGLDF